MKTPGSGSNTNSSSLSDRDKLFNNDVNDMLLLAERFLQNNDLESAHKHFTQVLERDSKQAGAHFGLAKVFQSVGEIDAALRAYKNAVTVDPHYVQAYVAASILLRDLGQPRLALQAIRQGLAIDPQAPEGRKTLASLLCMIDDGNDNPALEQELISCFSEIDIDHQKLARLAAACLVNKYRLTNNVLSGQALQECIASMAEDDLWLQYLMNTININPVIETLVGAARCALLFELHQSKAMPENRLALCAAIGLQSFANEYLLDISDIEEKLLVEMKLSPSVTTVLLAAMYQPLKALISDTALLSAVMHEPMVERLVEYTFTHLDVEAELRNRIVSFDKDSGMNGNLADVVSQQVRAQYEQNPYPRWKAPPMPAPMAMTEILGQQPGFRPQPFLQNNISALIAGCGTGFEAIEIKRMDPSLNLTAIDLSASSLSYAIRMATHCGLTEHSINFKQGNILNIKQLEQEFDVIISSGVLHHMAEPVTGWRNLTDVLKAGGVMRISLYSELARRLVVAAREEIVRLGLSSEGNDIRQFRAAILRGELGAGLVTLAESDDFYSLSACRDLLFHVQEHRFNLRQIAAICNELGLTFIGIDLPAPWVMDDFKAMFPAASDDLDLEKWDSFEQRYPDTFVGMYHLWVQKIN